RVELAEDLARRPAVPGPDAALAEGSGRRRHVADADQVHRRRDADAHQSANSRPTHRAGLAGNARLERRSDCEGPGGRGLRLGLRTHRLQGGAMKSDIRRMLNACQSVRRALLTMATVALLAPVGAATGALPSAENLARVASPNLVVERFVAKSG